MDRILLRDRDRPCKHCGCEYGRPDPRNGQECIYCAGCGRWLYNSPKHERGLAPQPVRSEGVSPKVRYQVMERAGFKCELCGHDSSANTMHIGHLISQKQLRNLGLPLELSDDFDNLAWLCDSCNLGMGEISMPLHSLLVFLLKRKVKVPA